MLTSFSAIVCLALAILRHQIAAPAFDIGVVALQFEQTGFSLQPLVHQLLQIALRSAQRADWALECAGRV